MSSTYPGIHVVYLSINVIFKSSLSSPFPSVFLTRSLIRTKAPYGYHLLDLQGRMSRQRGYHNIRDFRGAVFPDPPSGRPRTK